MLKLTKCKIFYPFCFLKKGSKHVEYKVVLFHAWGNMCYFNEGSNERRPYNHIVFVVTLSTAIEILHSISIKKFTFLYALGQIIKMDKKKYGVVISILKVCTVYWKCVCLHWEVGGLDLKPVRFVNESLIFHLGWKLLSEDPQPYWTSRHRFFKNGRPFQHNFKSSAWSEIKSHIGSLFENSIWNVGMSNSIHFWEDIWFDRSFGWRLEYSLSFKFSR